MTDKATCETHGHLRGYNAKCVMCGVPVEPLEGPIEILCKEIGYRFDRKLESRAMLIAFVTVLVNEIASMRWLDEEVSKMGGKAPSDDSKEVLRLTRMMLDDDGQDYIEKAAMVHNLCHQVNPDEGPCDHLIDMLSSCASAIRFGLQIPCQSRHAAAAADHIWKHIYGIRQFDSFTGNWQKEWTRAMFEKAIIGRLP